MKRGTETYTVVEARGEGYGIHICTDCGNWQYTINNDPMFFHGTLCKKCFQNGIYNTLVYDKFEEEKNNVNRVL